MRKNDQALTTEEINDMKHVFELFEDESTKKINTKEILEAMKTLGFETKNPSIYEFISDLDSPLYTDGVDFNQFIDAINVKLSEKEAKEGMKRIFDLIIDNPEKNTITVNSLHKIINDLGDNMSIEAVGEMIKKVAKNGHEITFEEFYQIMTKTSFP